MRSSYKKVSGMTGEIRIRRCYGCGVILQTNDRYEPGYVNKNRGEQDDGLCDRCFKLRHPKGAENQVLDQAFVEVLTKARENQALFCYVVDAFTLESSIITSFSDLLGPNVLAVINKVDVLPADITNDEVIASVKQRMAKQGIAPVGYLLTSAAKGFDYQDFIANIDKYRQGHDVFFVGVSRVGKSALINNFLKYYDNPTKRTITKEPIGDSSLSLTVIPLDDESSIYDTPGIFDATSLLNQIDRRTLKYVQPRLKVEKRTQIIKPGEALLLGALAYGELKDGDKAAIDLYFSSDVEIVKVKANKAAEQFTKLCQDGHGRPTSPTVPDAKALEAIEVSLPRQEQPIFVDIKGFGKWKFVKPEGQQLVFYVPKGVDVVVNR